MDNEELTRQLMATFSVELEEHVATLNKGLLSLEKGKMSGDSGLLMEEVFRAAHSLKGASAAVGCMTSRLSHTRLRMCWVICNVAIWPLIPSCLTCSFAR